MSWQRVIETARKTGMPIIITDIAGRDPMVILPLEQFEAMAGEPTQPTASQPPIQKPVSIPADPEKRVEEILSEHMQKQSQKRMESSAVGLQDVSVRGSENPEIPLEEGFYLEPIDDKP